MEKGILVVLFYVLEFLFIISKKIAARSETKKGKKLVKN